MSRRLREEDLRAAWQAYQTHGTVRAAAEALGIATMTMQGRLKKAQAMHREFFEKAPRLEAPTSSYAAPQLQESVSMAGDRADVTKQTDEQVKTLDDLIRVCAIDTETWEVERWTANKWDFNGVVHYQVKATLKRKVAAIAARNEVRELVEQAKRELDSIPRLVADERDGAAGHLLELSIPDLHVGKLAWADETLDAHYDSQIAEETFRAAVDALIARTCHFGLERIVLPVGNDLLHSDTKQGTTTSGTPLDTDSRFQKNFGRARRMLTETIDKLRMIAPVDVVIVPGNHDQLSAWHLGDSLEAYYHSIPEVSINNAPSLRKYYRFGDVMLMFAHGNKGKLADYPLLMATEQPKMFGETRFREAHTGDKHQLRVQEHRGVKVRISPALCPADAWHSENLFTGNHRSAEAFVWHRTEGLVGTAYYTVPLAADEKAVA